MRRHSGRVTSENVGELFRIPVAHWPQWRRKQATAAMPVQLKDELEVVTAGGHTVTLPAGWKGAIAVDSDGQPYPIEHDVFAASYVNAATLGDEVRREV